MKCQECGCEEMLAQVVISKAVPMAKKGGSVNVAGQKVGQKDIKKYWDETLTGDDKLIRGPIFCADCGTEHVHVKGLMPQPIVAMSLEDALAKGYEDFVEEKGGAEEEAAE